MTFVSVLCSKRLFLLRSILLSHDTRQNRSDAATILLLLGCRVSLDLIYKRIYRGIVGDAVTVKSFDFPVDELPTEREPEASDSSSPVRSLSPSAEEVSLVNTKI